MGFFFFSYLFFLDQGSQLCNIATGNCNPKAKGSMHTTQFLSQCPCHEIPNVCTPFQSYMLLSILSSSKSPCRNRGEQKFPQWTLIFPFLSGCGAFPYFCLDIEYLVTCHDYVFLPFFFFFASFHIFYNFSQGLQTWVRSPRAKHLPSFAPYASIYGCYISPTVSYQTN